MTTKAQSSKGIRLGVVVGSTLYYFNEVKTTPEIGESPEKIDVTHLESGYHEYIKDIPDFSADLSFTMNAQPFLSEGQYSSVSDSNLNLLTSLDKDQAYQWVVEYPQLNQTISIVADFSYAMGAGSVSTAIEINLTLIPRGAPTFTEYNNACTVTFAANGGSGTMASVSYAFGTTIPCPENGFTAPAGKEFGGWTYSGGTLTEGESFVITGAETLTAIWNDE